MLQLATILISLHELNNLCSESGKLTQHSDNATSWSTGDRFPAEAGREISSFRHCVQIGFGVHPASSQWVSGALSFEGEAGHSPPSCAEVNAWSSTPPLILERLIVTHLVKKFPTFYVTRMFITILTGCFHSVGYVFIVRYLAKHNEMFTFYLSPLLRLLLLLLFSYYSFWDV
jgi:hypothetical protein